MKLTESQLKTIILEEAAKVNKAMSLKKQLAEVKKQLDEVMGGPHGEGKKTFKKASGGFSENQGALVEDEFDAMEEIPMEDEFDAMEEIPMEETFDFTEEELDEMLNMAETTGSEGAEDAAEMGKFDGLGSTVVAEAPKQLNMNESVEVLRMKKLAGLL